MKAMVTRTLRILGTAAAAGVLLAGCSATHVGESWQCPLAQGTSCTTIAEADPAVPANASRTAALFGEPLPGAGRRTGESAAGAWRGTEEVCTGGCGLLAWFRGWLGFGAEDHATRLPPAAPATIAAAKPAAGPDGEAYPVPPAADASLRVPEVLGRIWIAPFVDAAGIYREAHWVRVVLEPAGWKLP